MRLILFFINKIHDFLASKLGVFSYLINPLEIFSSKKISSGFVSIPIDKIRAWGGGCLDLKNNPFLADALDLCQYGNFSSPSNLEKFHDLYSKHDAAEVMGLEDDNFSFFRGKPGYFAVFPWDVSISELNIEKNRVATLKRELSRFSKSHDLLVNSKARVNAELIRLRCLYDSICKNGLSLKKNRQYPIIGQLLCDHDDWVVLIRHGEHRVACMAALGYAEIEILLKRNLIIYGSDCKSWPHVTDSNISFSAAYKLFRRIIDGDGKPPKINCIGYFI